MVKDRLSSAAVNAVKGRVARLTSVLLVPAAPDELAGAMRSGASAIVADLMRGSGSVEERRDRVVTWLGANPRADGGPVLLVQVHDLRSGSTDADLDAIFHSPPEGIMLPACQSGEDLQHLGAKLGVREAEQGLGRELGILAAAGSSAAGLLAMGNFAGASPRLTGLAWDRAALAWDLGLPLASPSADPIAEEPSPLAHARVLTLLAAKAAGVPAYDAACSLTGVALSDTCARGLRDGFSGKLCHEPRQVELIEAGYGRR